MIHQLDVFYSNISHFVFCSQHSSFIWTMLLIIGLTSSSNYVNYNVLINIDT